MLCLGIHTGMNPMTDQSYIHLVSVLKEENKKLTAFAGVVK